MKTASRIIKAYSTPDDKVAVHVRRLVLIYDLGLTACQERNLARFEEVLDVLQGRLNFAQCPSLGLLLYAQFNTARTRARDGNFVGAGQILAALRQAWTGNGQIRLKSHDNRRRVVTGLSVN